MASTKARWVLGVGVGSFSVVILIGATPSGAGTLDASWTAPTTNTDGSSLTDLASYRVYYGTQSAPCPGTTITQVASPTTSPGANQTVSFRLMGLAAGTSYNVAVSAVDSSGRESACSSVATAVARTSFALSPTGTVSFGTVSVGAFVDKTFTVSNTSSGSLSGSASVAAPFTIVSGSPFTLAGSASQVVTVRYTPTAPTTVSATLAFAAGGDTISVVATGSGAGAADTVAPTVAITSPTSTSTYTATTPSLTLQGTASDNVGVTQVT